MLNSWCDDYWTDSKKILTFLNEILIVTSSQSNNIIDRSKSDFCLGVDRETLTRTFFQTESNRPTTSVRLNEPSTTTTDGKEILPNCTNTTTEDRLLSCSMYYNPLYESFCEAVDDEKNCVRKKYSWLPDVRLDVLVCCARQTLDDGEFETFVDKNDWMNEFLTVNFFRFVYSYDARSVLPKDVRVLNFFYTTTPYDRKYFFRS